MCGRARLASDVSEIKLVFSIAPERPLPKIAASWNVAPTDPPPIVHYDPRPANAVSRSATGTCTENWLLQAENNRSRRSRHRYGDKPISGIRIIDMIESLDPKIRGWEPA
jgi:hypothetical protein